MVRDGGGVPVQHIFLFGRSKMDVGPNDILQNVGSMQGGDCKIPCIASNIQLLPQVGLHLEANKNAVFLKKTIDFWYIKYWYRNILHA